MPYRSYAARLSSSLRISYAAATFLNMASARSLSSRFLSGCQRTASLRYARRISSPPALRLTPRRAYRSSSIPTYRTQLCFFPRASGKSFGVFRRFSTARGWTMPATRGVCGPSATSRCVRAFAIRRASPHWTSGRREEHSVSGGKGGVAGENAGNF